jgi:hypothetical protein
MTMKTDKEVIDDVVFETDMKALENGTIEDIERFIYSVIGHSLIEQGIEDEE